MARTIEVHLVDGETFEVYGHARASDGVLSITETYGDGTGVKDQRHFPLVQVKYWRDKQ